MAPGLVVAGLDWKEGDEVLLPRGEFPANRFPWLSLEARGVTVREVDLPRDETAAAALIAEMGDRTQRVENPEEDVDAALADVTEPERDDHRLEGELPQLERIEPDLPPDPEALLGEVPPDDEAPSLDELAAPTAMERFVGWGFRDWMEVRDARPEAERVLRRQLEHLLPLGSLPFLVLLLFLE